MMNMTQWGGREVRITESAGRLGADWIAENERYDINRLRAILRSDRATPEDRASAQNQLEVYGSHS